MTPFAALRTLAGLTNGEAAALLGTREQQAKDMSMGRRSTPPGVIVELLQLIRRQEDASAEILVEARRADDVVHLDCPDDNAEARALGWPCVGAWGAMAARVIVASPQPVVFVPYAAAARAAEERPIPKVR